MASNEYMTMAERLAQARMNQQPGGVRQPIEEEEGSSIIGGILGGIGTGVSTVADFLVPNVIQRFVPWTEEKAYWNVPKEELMATIGRDALDAATYVPGLQVIGGSAKAANIGAKLFAPLIGASIGAGIASEGDTFTDFAKKAALGAAGGAVLGPVASVASREASKLSPLYQSALKKTKQTLVDPLGNKAAEIGEKIENKATSRLGKWLGESLQKNPLDWQIIPGELGGSDDLVSPLLSGKSIREMWSGGFSKLSEEAQVAFTKARGVRSNISREAVEIGKEISKFDTDQKLDFIASLRTGEKSALNDDRVNQALDQVGYVTRNTAIPRAWKKQADESINKVFDNVPMDLREKFNIGQFVKRENGIPKTNREIIHKMSTLLSDKNTPDVVRQAIIDLDSLATRFPEDLIKNSQKISQSYLAGSLGRLSGESKVFFNKGDKNMPKWAVESKWGPLKGKGVYVDRATEVELMGFSYVHNQADSLIRRFTRQFKAAKISLDPSAMIRNVGGNIILNDYGGLSATNIGVYARAAREMAQKSRLYQKWQHDTGGGLTLINGDINQFASSVGKSKSMGDLIFPTELADRMGLSKLRDLSEEHAKFAKYIDNIDKGLSHEKSMLDAMKWTFDYSRVTPEVAALRETIMPFATWSSKIIPLYIEAVVNNPVRVGKWPAMMKAMHEISIYTTKMNDIEGQDFLSKRPDYQDNFLHSLIPFRDKEGRLQTFDSTYWLPGVGDLVEIFNNGAVENIVSHPLINFTADYLKNEKYGGQPIYDEYDDRSTQAMKVVGHAWNQLAPSIMPFGRHFDTVLDSMINDESRMTPSQAIATTLGIRLNPLDPERIERGYKFRNDRAMSYIRKQYKQELLEAKTSEDVEKSLDRMTNNIYRLMPESFDMESARSKIHRDIVKQIRKESRGK